MKALRILLMTCFLSLAVAGVEQTYAQCSMCRRVAESNMENGENKRGRGLNNGILYMMSVPYLLGGVGVFIWWRNRKSNN